MKRLEGPHSAAGIYWASQTAHPLAPSLMVGGTCPADSGVWKDLEPRRDMLRAAGSRKARWKGVLTLSARAIPELKPTSLWLQDLPAPPPPAICKVTRSPNLLSLTSTFSPGSKRNWISLLSHCPGTWGLETDSDMSRCCGGLPGSVQRVPGYRHCPVLSVELGVAVRSPLCCWWRERTCRMRAQYSLPLGSCLKPGP